MILCSRPAFTEEVMMENPSSLDICCGRGKGKWNSPGNLKFKALVLEYLEIYESAPSKAEKSKVVETVVKEVRDRGGRFLKRDENSGKWKEIRPAERRAKVAHCIRDHLATTKKNSTRSNDRSLFPGSHSTQARASLRMDKSTREANAVILQRASNNLADMGSQSLRASQTAFMDNLAGEDLLARHGAHSQMGASVDQLSSLPACSINHAFPQLNASNQVQNNMSSSYGQLLSQSGADTALLLQGGGNSMAPFVWSQNLGSFGLQGGMSAPFFPLMQGQFNQALMDPNSMQASMFLNENQTNGLVQPSGTNSQAGLTTLQPQGSTTSTNPDTTSSALNLSGDVLGLGAANAQSLNFPTNEQSQLNPLASSTRRRSGASGKQNWDFIEEEFAANSSNQLDEPIEPNFVFPPNGGE